MNRKRIIERNIEGLQPECIARLEKTTVEEIEAVLKSAKIGAHGQTEWQEVMRDMADARRPFRRYK